MGQIPRSTLITQSKRRAALHTHPAFAGSWEREVTQQSRRPFAQTGLSPGTRNSHGYEVRVALTDGGLVRLRRLLRSAKALKNGGVWYEVITGTWPSVTCPIMTHEFTSLPPPTVQNGAVVRFFLDISLRHSLSVDLPAIHYIVTRRIGPTCFLLAANHCLIFLLSNVF